MAKYAWLSLDATCTGEFACGWYNSQKNDNFTMAVENEGVGGNSKLNDSLVCRFCLFSFSFRAPLPFDLRLEFKNDTEPSQVRVQENNATFEIKKKTWIMASTSIDHTVDQLWGLVQCCIVIRQGVECISAHTMYLQTHCGSVVFMWRTYFLH